MPFNFNVTGQDWVQPGKGSSFNIQSELSSLCELEPPYPLTLVPEQGLAANSR